MADCVSRTRGSETEGLKAVHLQIQSHYLEDRNVYTQKMAETL